MLFWTSTASGRASLADEVEGETRDSLPELVAESDVVLLAVKPAALDEVRRADGQLGAGAALGDGRDAHDAPGGGLPGHADPAGDAQPAGRGPPRRALPPARGSMPEELETRLLDLLEALGTVVAVPEELTSTRRWR